MSHRIIRPPRPPNALRAARFAPAVLRVLEALDRAGHRSWLVGGAVRDVLLGRERAAADLDVATPARPGQVTEIFPRTIPTGIEHGTVTVLLGGEAVEVTTFRGEGAYVDGRRPSTVTFLDDIDDDLSRRDFTVNAMAWDPIGAVFRDPFGGRADLRARVLRAVGDPAARFREDGLRPLRAARFAAQLGFSVERRTAAAIPGALPTVRRVAVERITDELARLLVASKVRRGLDLLEGTRLMEVVLPDLAALPERAVRHAFDVTSNADPELAVRLAALLHALGPGGGAAAAEGASAALSALRFPGAVRDRTVALVGDHRCLAARSPSPLPGDDAGTRRWLAHVGDRASALLALGRAEVRATGATATGRRRASEVVSFSRRVGRVLGAAPPLAPSALALDGRAVMEILRVPGGPAVGAALRHLLDRVLMDPAMNTREGLTSALKEWWAGQEAAGGDASAAGLRRGAGRGPGRPR